MKANSQIACHDCDLLIVVPEMADNHSLICPGCKTKQFTKYKNPLDYTIAFASAALIMLFLANSFPFLSFEAQGQSSTITIVEASYRLALEEFYLIAGLVYAFVILLPFIYLVSLLLLLLPIKLRKKPFKPIILGRIMSFFLPWIMAEVFIVGVLVALIKIIELADIILGFAFWAYIVFVICFTFTANVANRHQLWQWIDDAK
jgi:paraquat-inducible protein A